MPCTPDAPVPWQLTVEPTGTTPYEHGDAEVAVRVTATDPFFLRPVTVEQTAVVKLKQVNDPLPTAV